MGLAPSMSLPQAKVEHISHVPLPDAWNWDHCEPGKYLVSMYDLLPTYSTVLFGESYSFGGNLALFVVLVKRIVQYNQRALLPDSWRHEITKKCK